MSGGGVGVGQGVVGLGGAVVHVNDEAQSRSVEENGSGIRLDQNQAKLEHLLFQVKLHMFQYGCGYPLKNDIF